MFFVHYNKTTTLGMENVTLLLQGHLKQETLDFFMHYHSDVNIIVSTWFEEVSFQLPPPHLMPPRFKIIQSKQPSNPKGYSVFYQFMSTLNGLRHVETKYVIKLRADEFFSQLTYIADKMCEEPDIVFTSPVFFRKWDTTMYHISDHLIAGTTANIRLMFEGAREDYESGLFDSITYVPEQVLALAYLKRKWQVHDFTKVDGPELMRTSFSILDLTRMIPYKIVANCFHKEWYSNFLPEWNNSISDIRDL